MAKIISDRKTVILIYNQRNFENMIRKLSKESPDLSLRQLAKVLGISRTALMYYYHRKSKHR